MYPNNTNAAQGMAGNGNVWIPAVGQTTARNEVERVLMLDEVVGSLGGANNVLYELIADMRIYADSLLGSQPEPGNISNAGQSIPKIATRLDGLREGVGATHQWASELRRQFERIRAV